MARVAILCFTELAISTASAATLPWLKFGAVAMMIDALGFKVRTFKIYAVCPVFDYVQYTLLALAVRL